VQLYLIAQGFGGSVGEALRRSAMRFPAFAGANLEQATSADGSLAFATVGHPATVSAGRRYLARRGSEVVVFDGLPIDRYGQFPASDASELLARWAQLPDALEGIFSAVRVDLEAGTVDCLTDVLGMARVFCHQRGDRWVVGNNLEAVSAVADRHEPDLLGVGSLFTMGWPVRGSTPIRGVRTLPGGHVHAFGPRGGRSVAHFTPAMVVPRRQAGTARAAAEVAHAMVRTTAAARVDAGPLVCGVTAGRDTRVLLALARAAEWDAQYYTSGEEVDVDVRVARDLAAALDLPYRLVTPAIPDDHDSWRAMTAQFVAQTDGMVSLKGIDDWIDHQTPIDQIGLKLWGPGGEIGRAGNIGLAIPLVANTWGLRWAASSQRWVLRHKAQRGDLFRPEALELTRDALDGFANSRLREGWRPREILEAYYGFERVAHWAAGGVRRASNATDLYSPFVSRDYIRWCFSLSPGERFVEAPHWRLLTELAPDMRDLPFEHPWRPQRPRGAQAMVLRDVGRHVAARAAMRLGRRPPPPPKRPNYGARWLEFGREMHRELCFSHPSSALWGLVDRKALERALSAPVHGAVRPGSDWISVCHALTAFWWFHGRDSAAVTAPLRKAA
jgi:asparagine synthase (glutamine-hydrolysing)